MECTDVSDGDLEDFSVVQKILLIIYPENYSAREDFEDFFVLYRSCRLY
jgi:hypothetical protein